MNGHIYLLSDKRVPLPLCVSLQTVALSARYGEPGHTVILPSVCVSVFMLMVTEGVATESIGMSCTRTLIAT